MKSFNVLFSNCSYVIWLCQRKRCGHRSWDSVSGSGAAAPNSREKTFFLSIDLFHMLCGARVDKEPPISSPSGPDAPLQVVFLSAFLEPWNFNDIVDQESEKHQSDAGAA
ncbi:hypothetical protein F2P81_003751 [Scophthalmus maximus]|uniref:Uncharacterized protein n=1 Tax=Scophthalmus maximus TaxID=52904 RepID=A0A6A4TF17_SCOMX|nr:hypothetical protein F2P81_003751 [Scophthalmus maximus]